MSDLDINPSGFWDGPFTYDEQSLYAYIQRFKRDYDMNNPRTWPLIMRRVQPENNTDYRKTEIPPPFLAYEQSFMERLVQIPSLLPTGRDYVLLPSFETLNYRFRNYPFNFDTKDQLRKYPHIPPRDFREWIKAMTWSAPYSNQVLGVQSVENAREQSATSSRTASTVSPVSAFSPVSAYEQIMEVLTEAKKILPKAVAELEKELDINTEKYPWGNLRGGSAEEKIKALEDQLQAVFNIGRANYEVINTKLLHIKSQQGAAKTEEKRRMEIAEADRLKYYERELAKIDDKLIAARKKADERIMKAWAEMQKTEEKRRMEIAEADRLKCYEKELEKIDDKLIATRKKADERIMKAWAEMQKAEDTAARKRKATEDVLKLPPKMAKKDE